MTEHHHQSIVGDPKRQFRAKHKIESQSTIVQEATELECRPYFVHLPSLPPSQLEHLRETGLLHEQRKSNRENDDDDKCEDNDNVAHQTTTSSKEEDDSVFPYRISLLKSKHLAYVSKVFVRKLPSSMVPYDASQTWIMYWCLHSCDLLAHDLPVSQLEAILSSLQTCWTSQTVRLDRKRLPTNTSWFHELEVKDSPQTDGDYVTLQAGGFGGGPGQLPHAATTYATVLVLCILATNDATAIPTREYLKRIRAPLAAWMASLQQLSSGGFRMHDDGEVDVRATYCVATVASLLALEDCILHRASAAQFVARCQTYEGGFGGEPMSEAHGGYTFCALAALLLLLLHSTGDGSTGTSNMQLQTLVDMQALLGWLARRQMGYEGGFQGRTNKLVDGCYSFWQGSAMAIVNRLVTHPNDNISLLDKVDWTTHDQDLLFDTAMLERYILLCGQDVEGGMRDKPSASRDFYHTCYVLSGLSVAQLSGIQYGHNLLSKVANTHPIYNIRNDRVEQIRSYFARLRRVGRS